MPFSWRVLCWCADFLDPRGMKLHFLNVVRFSPGFSSSLRAEVTVMVVKFQFQWFHRSSMMAGDIERVAALRMLRDQVLTVTGLVILSG